MRYEYHTELNVTGGTIYEHTIIDGNNVSISQSFKPHEFEERTNPKWWENREETWFFNNIRSAIRIFKGIE